MKVASWRKTYGPARTDVQTGGFTIVELLVVIVVIGILAAITIVSYAGVSQKAVATSLTSDLDNASRQLKLYQVDHGTFPTSPLTVTGSKYCPADDNRYCFRASSGNTITYTNVLPSTFSLKATDNSNTTAYSITNSSMPTTAATTCPTGFIPVPGSSTYGTNDFCVMKYVASHSDATAGTQGTSTTPISAPGVQQWVNVSQTAAIANSPNVAGCPTCHLITEAEWLTIAQNVLSVPGNWSGAAVGSGYISSGHNDNAPANALVADPSDANGNAGETNQTFAQKRTLTLTNGQVIWDMAGNVMKWTSGTTTTVQPGIIGELGYAYKEWISVTTQGTLTPYPSPASTGITGASSWTTSNGVGILYSYAGEVSPSGCLRGGYWNDGSWAGILALGLSFAPNTTNTLIGFRVSR
ncbi:MAG: prepilin-type N-terminal cleavage/methylation domain-containing protein [Candidatus Saccharibacteria bacterium]|nr:prepilin-type N-terminal cleavage/methylation domain-containing protein [Candidatus Saccharibacteria bacterium]